MPNHHRIATKSLIETTDSTGKLCSLIREPPWCVILGNEKRIIPASTFLAVTEAAELDS